MTATNDRTDDVTTSKQSRIAKWIPVALIVIVLVLIAGVLWWMFQKSNTTKITAYFDKSVGIYQGSEIRVLGVQVGNVDSVVPQGDQVEVKMTVDRKYDIPADAKAAQVTPSVVADRYIQLTPAYSGGPKMDRDATIPRNRTATPVEVDQLYKSVTDLSNALGPNGANKNGALSDLLKTTSANLSGNGQALSDSITQLSKAARSLSDSRSDVFDTIKNLQTFVSMLAQNDDQVRQFNGQLADLSGFLAGEREDLGKALNLLSTTLGDVARFVDDNREKLGANAQGLTTITKTLSDQREDLAKALPQLPVALSNLVNIHNAESGTLDLRPNISDLQDPFGLACKLIDFRTLRPGDEKFEALGRQMRPLIDRCKSITDQITAGVKTPTLNLPFGILSGENQQRNPVPGTQPGVPSQRTAPSEQGEQTEQQGQEGGQ